MRRQVLRGALLRAVTTPLNLLLSLTAAWLAVGHLGPVVWGAVLLVVGLPLLLPFADMGVGAAVINVLSGDRRADQEYIRATLRRAQLALVVVGLVIAGGGVVLGAFVPLRPVFGRGIDALPGASEGICVFFVVFGINVMLQLGTSVLLGLGRNGAVMLLGVLAGVLSLGGMTVGVALDAPPVWFLLAQPTAQASAAAVGLVAAFRLLRLRPAALLRRARITVRLLSTAAPMVVISAGAALSMNTDRLVMSHVGTARQLAEYSIASQLYLPAWAAVGSVLIVLWPIFNRMRAEQGSEQSIKALFSTARLMTLVGVILGGGFTLASVPLSAVISHGQATTSWALAAAFGALLAMQTAWKPVGVYLTDARGLRFQAVCIASMGLFGLPLSIFGAALIGPAGPVCASVVALTLFVVLPGMIYVRSRSRGVLLEVDPVPRTPSATVRAAA